MSSICDSCRFDKLPYTEEPCESCRVGDSHFQPIRRYDRIMQDMTVAEMGELRTEYCTGDGDYWYENDAGKWHDLSSAIQAEIEWLQGVDE